MKYHEDCHCCGQRVTAYVHPISKPMIDAFVVFCNRYVSVKRPVNPWQEISLSHSQVANFQKLRYYDLVKQVDGNGLWVPTELGLRFFEGTDAVLHPVATIKGDVLNNDHQAWKTHVKPRAYLRIFDFGHAPYKRRPDFQAEKSGQGTLV